jgi:hypothetical protein
MSILEIGCCGAYCRTCRAFVDKSCYGCKIGYSDGKRDIAKAKCPMKVCCMKTYCYQSCADCAQYESCTTLKKFHSKNGYKYRKYKESLEYIRTHGYERFLQMADHWKCAYGKLKES